MNRDHAEPDFSHSPRQRQRRCETGFYRALGMSAAVAIFPGLLLGWQLDADSARLQAAGSQVQHELDRLQPRLLDIARLEAEIEAGRERLVAEVALATQRTFAPRALQALAAISPAHVRVQQLVLRHQELEIRGTAIDQGRLQDLVDALNASGLGQVRLQDMRQDPLAAAPLGTGFTLTLLGASTPSASPPAPSGEAVPGPAPAAAPRAKRT